MIRCWRPAVGALALTSALCMASPAFAADHLDSLRTRGDASADINDLFVFRGNAADLDGQETTVFIMTVVPAATADSRLSDQVEYVFNIAEPGANGMRWKITCTATTPDGGNAQSVTCAAPGGATDTIAFNTVDAGNPANETMRIYAGLVDDPFFFDLNAFNSVLDSVLAGAPDPGPLVDATGSDFFVDLNAVAIVVEIDNSVFGDASNLRVWASTERPAAQ